MRSIKALQFSVIALLAGWLTVFVLMPNLMMLVISVMTQANDDWAALPLTVANYQRLVDPLYAMVFARSLLMASFATFGCLVIAYPFAWLLARWPSRWRPCLLILVIVPFWTNSLVRIYALRSLLAARGLLNNILLGLGWIDAPVRLLYTESAVILGLLYVLLPFMILPLYGALEKFDGRLLEAAADLGASRWQCFWRILLPLSLPGVISGSLMVFLPALGMFYVTDILGGARGILIGNLLKDQFLDAHNWPFGSAISVILLLLLLLVLMGQRFIEQCFGIQDLQ